MITNLPAVQFNCKAIRRYESFTSQLKVIARRRYRRRLDAIVRAFLRDEERWYDECFNAPSLSEWELW